MTQQTSQFDDPALKAAIRQLPVAQGAPSDLRERIKRQIIEARQSDQTPAVADSPSMRIGSSRSWSWRPLAMAAMVLIVIGGAGGYMYYRHISELREEYVRNDALLDQMIDVEKLGATTAAGHTALTAALSDAGALASEATKQLGRAVPAPRIGEGRWKLDAASFCTVNAMSAIRFHFTGTGRSITVISLPASAWTGDHADGRQYDLVADGHPISGYVHNGSLNCVVGDTSTSPAEISRLRDELRRS